MRPSNSKSITLRHLDSVLKGHLQLASSLQQLELLAEIAADVSRSETLAMEVLTKIDNILEEKGDHNDWIRCADYASRLGLDMFENKFLLRGLDIYVTGGGKIFEYWTAFERLCVLSRGNSLLRRLIEKTVDECIHGLRLHGEDTVKIFEGISWFRRGAELVEAIYTGWNDPVYYADKTLSLLDVQAIDSIDRNDISFNLLSNLSSELRKRNHAELEKIYVYIKDGRLFGTYDSEFQELKLDFKKRLSEYEPQVTTTYVRDGKQ